jgi:ARID/BRIGHT DNA binding domain
MGTPFSFPANGTPSTSSGPSPLIQPNRPQGGNLVNFGKGPIHPLEKARFDLTYKTFCHRMGLKPDQRLLTIDSQPIDLHALHSEVLQEGGLKNVSPVSSFQSYHVSRVATID